MNFADLFLFTKVLFTNIMHARATPLALVMGVANVKAICEKCSPAKRYIYGSSHSCF